MTLQDATKVRQWNEYISEISTKWLKRQAQTTTILLTGAATTLLYLWTNANQAPRADVNTGLQTQASATQYRNLATAHPTWYPLFAAIGVPTRGTWWKEYYAANPAQSDEKVDNEERIQNYEDLLKKALDDQLHGCLLYTSDAADE